MENAIRARYANGVFMPDVAPRLPEGAVVSLLYDIDLHASESTGAEATLRKANTLLDDAERAFSGAFAPGGWDELTIKRGCRMAWDAAWMCAQQIAAERDWECETPDQGSRIMMRLGGVNEQDASGGDLALFQGFS